MQSKIRVYESGRTEQVMISRKFWLFPIEIFGFYTLVLVPRKKIYGFYLPQEYDPDLPPELAAATGVHDVPAENANLGKADIGQSDLGKGPARVRPPIVCTAAYRYYQDDSFR